MLPYSILVPLYFSSHLTYGAIAMGVAMAGQILNSMTLLMQFVPTISYAARKPYACANPGAVRSHGGGPKRHASPRLTIIRSSDRVVLQNVSLQTPGGSSRW